MPTPLRTAPIVQKSALDGTKSLIHGFRLKVITTWGIFAGLVLGLATDAVLTVAGT